MGKHEPDFIDNLLEELTDGEWINNMLALAGSMPPEVWLSVVLSYAWSCTHDGKITKDDIVLGTIGGFTLPSALKGNEIANLWATGYLACLGLNTDVMENLGRYVKEKLGIPEHYNPDLTEAEIAQLDNPFQRTAARAIKQIRRKPPIIAAPAPIPVDAVVEMGAAAGTTAISNP